MLVYIANDSRTSRFSVTVVTTILMVAATRIQKKFWFIWQDRLLMRAIKATKIRPMTIQSTLGVNLFFQAHMDGNLTGIRAMVLDGNLDMRGRRLMVGVINIVMELCIRADVITRL